MRAVFFLLIVIYLCKLCGGDDSFYDILGVPSNADTRTIRKAFKKLAIVKHPDKNKDDPDAHSVFVRINRAYEVLKDEELRKKYDEHGEAGLSDNFNANSQQYQYQSWQFYKDKFGIYDDDAEIVTLSRSDFHEEVSNSNELWFINFYSTFCSHCHTLAPTWREFAKRMDGIVRIGAVNCAEDPILCQSQHVMGYPSLVVYPQHTFYNGPREAENLVEFIIAYINTPVHAIRSMDDLVKIAVDRPAMPFVVEYCVKVNEMNDVECLSSQQRKQTAAILRDVAYFGVVNCQSASFAPDLCSSSKDTENKLVFYPSATFAKKAGEKIIYSDLKEVYDHVLAQISVIETIHAERLDDLMDSPIGADGRRDVVVIFFDKLDNKNAAENAECKKLVNLFPNVQAYLGDCSVLSAQCYHRLHLSSLPKVVLFRGGGGFDIHYGTKVSTNEVRKFLLKSLPASLVTLTDESYHMALQYANSEEIVLIDYFAPWCPPCLRLILELRALPTHVNGLRLRATTLNCEAYHTLCTQAGINSYPTTILYYKSNTYKTVGYHSSAEILEFIQESLNPSVDQLNYETFQNTVVNRPAGRMVLVDFYVSWCGPCQQLAPEFRKLARSFRNNSDVVSFGMVDCEQQAYLCQEQGIRGYPAIRLFDAAQDQQPREYPSNWWRDHKSMQHWLNEHLPSLVERITGDFHTRILGAETPVLVDFYAPWCGHCVHFSPILDQIAKVLEGEVRVAKVNCDMAPYICQTAAVQAYPALRLYLGTQSTGGAYQDAYGIAIQPQPNRDVIVDALRTILRQHGIHMNQIRDEL